jgi:hypothetical protein
MLHNIVSFYDGFMTNKSGVSDLAGQFFSSRQLKPENQKLLQQPIFRILQITIWSSQKEEARNSERALRNWSNQTSRLGPERDLQQASPLDSKCTPNEVFFLINGHTTRHCIRRLATLTRNFLEPGSE